MKIVVVGGSGLIGSRVVTRLTWEPPACPTMATSGSRTPRRN